MSSSASPRWDSQCAPWRRTRNRAGWGLAAAVGAVAGILLYAFAAALLGGIDSPGGAVVGGFAVGVLENVLGAYVIGNDLKLSVALGLIIGVLLVRPSCFFGKVHVTRV